MQIIRIGLAIAKMCNQEAVLFAIKETAHDFGCLTLAQAPRHGLLEHITSQMLLRHCFFGYTAKRVSSFEFHKAVSDMTGAGSVCGACIR